MQTDSLFDVSNEVVVITGAAGLLGYEYAKAFLIRGARVVGIDQAHSNRSEDLERLFPQKYLHQIVDVSSKTSLQAAAAESEGRFGVASVLINNAAIDSPPSAPIEQNGPFEDYPESVWDQVMEVNLKGVFLTCQIYGARMASAGHGSIINIASIYGVVSPDQGLYAYRRERGEQFFKPIGYAVSKSGILNLSRYLAVYWAKSGVRVNTLTLAGVENAQEGDFLKNYCERIPCGRMASADEYNGSVLFLASRASSYMTGSNLVVDGGWTAI